MRTLEANYTPVGLPDKDDEHVVALAKQEGAATSVTCNLKDFPEVLLKVSEITPMHPDSFLCALFDDFHDEVIASVGFHIRALSNTKPTKANYFESLEKAGVKEFVKNLKAVDLVEGLFDEVWI